MTPAGGRERVRCRLIGTDDLGAVAALLETGFPGRGIASWKNGLLRLAARQSPQGTPQFGYCLDTGNKLVGVILVIASTRMVNGEPAIFSNVASWYVSPDYRANAQLLVSIALRNKETTYTNVSPAPHTWNIVENQGYKRFCGGLFFAAAVMARPRSDIRLEAFEAMAPADAQNIPDCLMLQRHHEMGCKVLVVHEGEKRTGFVFRRYRIRSGRIPLPAMMVIHAPDREQLVRLAGNFGRHFLAMNAPFLVMDADGPVQGLWGIYTEVRGRKYFKGPHKPSLCDLSDTEYAFFGV
jgi:hypothetical protein